MNGQSSRVESRVGKELLRVRVSTVQRKANRQCLRSEIVFFLPWVALLIGDSSDNINTTTRRNGGDDGTTVDQ